MSRKKVEYHVARGETDWNNRRGALSRGGESSIFKRGGRKAVIGRKIIDRRFPSRPIATPRFDVGHHRKNGTLGSSPLVTNLDVSIRMRLRTAGETR